MMLGVLAKVLLFLTLTITNKFSTTVYAKTCRQTEQQALESAKKHVYDPTHVLSSWIVGKDCCEWEGVVCHNLTNHVIELHIVVSWDESTYLRINNLRWLQNLSNLEHLEMDSVDLSKTTNWVQVINMFPSLLSLRFPNCNLNHIPPQLFHHNFSSLESLDLSNNNFSSPVPKWIFNLDTLVSLDLSWSNFIGPFPEGPVNLTSLTTFWASGNSFNSLLPKWLFSDLTNLEYLDLSDSRVEGPIQSNTGNITKLTGLYLSGNYLNSTIPNWLYLCKNLKSLKLHANNLEGIVSSQISNLSSVTNIDLSNNKLSGTLPESLGNCSSLTQLSLAYNTLSGTLPESLGNCSSLKLLDLANNKLTGTLPKGLGLLTNLISFYIFNNMLEGIVTESHFTGLRRLQYFEASGNNLTLKVSQNWIPPFQAKDIHIGSWIIGTHFPNWIKTQKQIREVDISNSGIQGEVPIWFWKLTSQIQLLNLSRNQFVGEVSIFSAPSDGQILYLGSNNFSGSLPRISTSVSELDLSDNSFSKGLTNLLCKAKKERYKLRILNLGGNDLSGEIPDCWMNWPELEVLILRENNLSGVIPNSIEFLSHLRSLDFRRNILSGPFPTSLEKCTELRKIDLAENEFVGKLPPWLGTRLSRLIILSLRSNKFRGELVPELCYLNNLQILDFADNAFTGAIPMCISNFSAMVTGEKAAGDGFELDYSLFYGYVRENAVVTTKGNTYQYGKILELFASMDLSSNNLSGDIPISLTSLVGLRSLNFSRNHLSGRIPNSIGNMKELESVDLSKNQLSGPIPQSISSLFSLGYLNISYNYLSGKIPVSTQLQSFNVSSFQGNKLCGLPLLVNCSSRGQFPNLVNKKGKGNDEDEMDWFYISMAIGFALHFWAVSLLLIFKRSWRHAYYRFLDNCWISFKARVHYHL